MANKPRWNYVKFENGVLTVELTGWKHFGAFVNQIMMDYPQFIWRGQRCDYWKLEPTLDRYLREIGVKSSKSIQKKHLEQFQYASRGRRGMTPPPLANDDDWWALGQHHGLATPLLDWTRSPYVASYFAYMEGSDNSTDKRAIFAVQEGSLLSKSRLLIKNHNYNEDDVVKIIRPLSDENPRLVNQGGLFTKSPAGVDLEHWVKTHFKEDKKNTFKLLKLLVPDEDREFSLKALNRMNINHLTLFPDLYGASKFANMCLTIPKY